MWSDFAACRGSWELFDATFVMHDRRTPTRTEQAALDICNTCPVRTECLDAELDTMRQGLPSLGVFGGTTARQRRDLLAAHGWRRPKAPGKGHYTPPWGHVDGRYLNNEENT